MKTARLSKSKYLSGLQCHKRLWLEIHLPELIPPVSSGQQRIFDQGTLVGELARKQFPDGILIEADHLNIPEAVEQTKAALAEYADVIFEGCFICENVLVRPDILIRNDDGGWNLIEVKSSTRVKEENVHDIAIQTWVLQGYEFDINRMFLMHINRDCEYPDLSNLFKSEDISEQVNIVLPDIQDVLSEYIKILEVDEPDIKIGQHCGSPYDCPFVEHCWGWVPKHSIFTIPRLRWTVKERLLKEGHVAINDLPTEFPLNDNQQNYVKSLEREEPIIDWDGIRSEFGKLEYPIHFLDFETDGPAVPRFDGMHPYEQFPFQYSCHIIDTDGTLSNVEYLHEAGSDPRRAVTESLIDNIGSMGTVIAYNAGFEKGVLNKLAGWFPEHKERIQSIINRLWDQLVIFRKYYTDYRFGGSNSLKNVLPVMVPSLNYENLDVKEGSEAQVVWNKMIELPECDEKDKLVNQLKEYCGQDTLAMFEIHKGLLR